MLCEPCSSKALLLLKQLCMKPGSMPEPFDLVTGRAGRPRDWVRVLTLSLVVAGSFLLQGCLAGAWVALVALDSMRSSHVTFWPFEQSWVAQDRKSTRLNSSHIQKSRMPSSA